MSDGDDEVAKARERRRQHVAKLLNLPQPAPVHEAPTLASEFESLWKLICADDQEAGEDAAAKQFARGMFMSGAMATMDLIDTIVVDGDIPLAKLMPLNALRAELDAFDREIRGRTS